MFKVRSSRHLLVARLKPEQKAWEQGTKGSGGLPEICEGAFLTCPVILFGLG